MVSQYINYLVLFLLIISPRVNAEQEEGIIDKMSNKIDALVETRTIKEKSIEQYNEKKVIKKSSQTDDGFDLGVYADKIKKFASDKLNSLNINVNAAAANQVTYSIRDPFNLSSQSGLQGSGRSGFGTSFLPDMKNNKIPSLKLKGVIYPKSDDPEDLLALLEIGKKEVYMVRVGDEISYDRGDPNAAIKVINISRLTVTVQAGSLGNVLIIR